MDFDDLESNKGHKADTTSCGSCNCLMSWCGDFIHMLEESCFEWDGTSTANHITLQKVEPKLFFANERTFVSWLVANGSCYDIFVIDNFCTGRRKM